MSTLLGLDSGLFMFILTSGIGFLLGSGWGYYYARNIDPKLEAFYQRRFGKTNLTKNKIPIAINANNNKVTDQKNTIPIAINANNNKVTDQKNTFPKKVHFTKKPAFFPFIRHHRLMSRGKALKSLSSVRVGI